MAWQVGEDSKALRALSDFTNMQYRIVELATTEPNACDYAPANGGYGVLMNEPRQYEAATVMFQGECRCRAGKAIAIGDRITAAASGANGSGWATNVASGAAVKILGIARSACASGSLFTLEFIKQGV